MSEVERVEDIRAFYAECAAKKSEAERLDYLLDLAAGWTACAHSATDNAKWWRRLCGDLERQHAALLGVHHIDSWPKSWLGGVLRWVAKRLLRRAERLG